MKHSIWLLTFASLYVPAETTRATDIWLDQPNRRQSFLGTFEGGRRRRITDDELAQGLRDVLFSDGEREYESLAVTMGQCRSGGFIDDFISRGFTRFSIDTASRWNRNAVGTNGGRLGDPPEGFSYYLNAWYDQVNVAPADQPGMLAAFTGARANLPGRIRRRSIPQYASRPDAEDARRLNGSLLPGGSAASKSAILVVGVDAVRGGFRRWRHFNELTKMVNVLKGRYAFAQEDMYILYVNDTLPDGTPTPGWVRGAATRATVLTDAMTWLDGRIAGQDDFVFTWTYGHGGVGLLPRAGQRGDSDEFAGLTIPGNDSAMLEYELIAEDFDWFADPTNSSPLLEVFAEAVQSETSVAVYLNDPEDPSAFLGYLDPEGSTELDLLPFSESFETGINTLYYVSSQEANVFVSESLITDGLCTEVPEPATLGMMILGALMLTRGRRR